MECWVLILSPTNTAPDRLTSNYLEFQSKIILIAAWVFTTHLLFSAYRRINPVQSKFVNWVTGGEGWHNYHHCFPWDYGLSEFGFGKGLATYLIEFFAKVGLASDLRKASDRVVVGHATRHGDGSHKITKKQD